MAKGLDLQNLRLNIKFQWLRYGEFEKREEVALELRQMLKNGNNAEIILEVLRRQLKNENNIRISVLIWATIEEHAVREAEPIVLPLAA